jgi:hypothetical protein
LEISNCSVAVRAVSDQRVVPQPVNENNNASASKARNANTE